MSSNSHTLRERAEHANRVKVAERQALAVRQVQEVYAVLTTRADQGFFDASYHGALCEEAVKMLENGGDKIKVRDDGEGVANAFHLEW